MSAQGNIEKIFNKRIVGNRLLYCLSVVIFSILSLPFNSFAIHTKALLESAKTLGSSVRVALTTNGNIRERNDYYPFGLRTDQGRAYPTFSDRYTVKVPRLTQGPNGTNTQTGYRATAPYTLQYNGKELQLLANTALIDYGARQYNPILARWTAQDPMAEKYYGISPYAYCYNNPIVFIDPNGRQVNAVFSKSTGYLYIHPNVSKEDKTKAYRTTSAENYFNLSKEQRSEYNYIIAVEEVFSGGHFDKNKNRLVLETDPKEKPISKGLYHILENKGNDDPNHDSFFVLDAVDNMPYNKIDDREGEINADGEKRFGYNLHPGNVSHGCVTILLGNNQTERKKEWDMIVLIIRETRTKKVPDNRGLHRYFPGKQIKYGTLKVID